MIRKNNKFSKRMIATVLIAIFTFTGCSSKPSKTDLPVSPTTAPGSENAGGASDSKREPLDTISMLVNYTGAEAPNEDSEVIKKIQEYTGTKLEIIWVPQSAYSEKLNTLIASKALPQITVIREVKAAGIVNAARSGMFWDVSSYLSDYNNLGNIDNNILRNVQIDGGQYLIPRVREVAREGAVLRTDWLNNLGLKMPTTIDELYEVLKAFTYDDPDQNGKNDTIGFSLKHNALPRFSTMLSVFMGGPNTWGIDSSGQVVPEFYFDTYTEALTWFRNAYADGLFNQDFPVCKDEMQNFNSGVAGMLFLGNVEDAATRVTDLNAIFPNATTDIFMTLTDGASGEKHLSAHTGYTGALAFPKTAVKSEEELLGILDFIEKLGEPEMVDLFNWGIEGETYTLVGNAVEQSSSQADTFGSRFNDFRQITPFYTTRHLEAVGLPELNTKITTMMNENVTYVVHNVTLPYISDTYVESGGEIETQINDAKIKYVIGEIDLDGWNQAIESWKKAGGEKMIKEYTEQYNADN